MMQFIKDVELHESTSANTVQMPLNITEADLVFPSH